MRWLTSALAVLGLVLLGAAVLVWQPVAQALGWAAERGGGQSLELLAMVPVAVTAVVFLRVVIGLDSFGIFGPLILGLAFSRLSLGIGVLCFGLLVVLVTPLRLLLERMPVLSIARTGMLVAACAVGLLAVAALLPAAGLATPQSGLPVVVMASIIDRFVSAQMDQSTSEAVKLSAGTLVVAAFVGLLVEYRGMILGDHPDVVLLAFPLLALLGRYTGLRLTELYRFRDVARS